MQGEMTYTRLRDQVLDSLTLFEGQTTAEVAAKLGAGRSSVSSRLSELRKQGKVLRDEDGNWYAAAIRPVSVPQRKGRLPYNALLTVLIVALLAYGAYWIGMHL